MRHETILLVVDKATRENGMLTRDAQHVEHTIMYKGKEVTKRLEGAGDLQVLRDLKGLGLLTQPETGCWATTELGQTAADALK